MVRPRTYSFEHSPDWKGVGVEGDADVSHDVVRVSGRYPDEGCWARNQESHMSVIVASGIGAVAIRGVGEFTLDVSAPDNRTIEIEPGQWSAFDGHMTVSIVHQPAFNARQYEVAREDRITEELDNEI